MKKITNLSYLVLITLSFLFTSCENESLEGFDLENGNVVSNNLLGTWTLDNFNLSVNSSSEIAGTIIESSTVVESENTNYDLTFLPSTFTTNGSYSYVVDLAVNGQQNTQNLSVENVSGSGNYTTNGSEVTSDGSFVTFEFEGSEFLETNGEQTSPYTISADGQTLTFTQNTTETVSQDGFTSTSVVMSTSVWTKVNTVNNPCEDAITFVEVAANQYNADSTNVDLCNAYNSALQNQINSCGDPDGSLQELIDGLNCETTNQASIIGVWLEVAFTSNGEVLPDVCIGDVETYTATTFHYAELWGDNCENLNEDGDPIPYTLIGNQLSSNDNGEIDTVEVLELTETTLKYQYVYTDGGVEYVDIHTFTRQ